ncbi:MAG: cytochrome-c oxidase, cbb3-type subunit III [Micavibrio sp.]|nr:cytochrome-c oxidase, cbb3-type subunit III [Micavibrio sp.]
MTEEHKPEKEIDEISGTETTGHEWDGMKELNTPIPRWWLWVWFISILWSVWYFVVYPAWPVPGGATEGTSGYTQYKELAESQGEIVALQRAYLEQMENSSFAEIMDDPALYDFAMSGGEAYFKENCATCHGTGAEGSKGYPNLNDDDWLWGGSVEEIHQTLKYGIRSDHDDTRYSLMPSFGKDKLLTSEQISQLVEYVDGLSDEHEKLALAQSPAHQIFQQNCASCHGADGRGGREFGAPNLADEIWLYGGSEEDIYASIYNARAGMMPAWVDRLSPQTLRQLAIYVHELGGGEESSAQDRMEDNMEGIETENEPATGTDE